MAAPRADAVTELSYTSEAQNRILHGEVLFRAQATAKTEGLTFPQSFIVSTFRERPKARAVHFIDL